MQSGGKGDFFLKQWLQYMTIKVATEFAWLYDVKKFNTLYSHYGNE